ncbi:MAG: hypothetical protein AAF633_28185 [Chloroflexota bacterium]
MHTENNVEQIIQKFHDRTLPKSEWTHLAHLITGLDAVLKHDLEGSIAVMREGIKGYNKAVGTVNGDHSGYHETITIFFCHALKTFVARHADTTAFSSWVDLLQNSSLVQEPFMFHFYSKKRLFSVEARRSWVKPDLYDLDDLDYVLFRADKTQAD